MIRRLITETAVELLTDGLNFLRNKNAEGLLQAFAKIITRACTDVTDVTSLQNYTLKEVK